MKTETHIIEIGHDLPRYNKLCRTFSRNRGHSFVTWRALNDMRVIEFSFLLLWYWVQNCKLAIFIWIQMLREVRFMGCVKQWHLQSELYAWRHLGVVGNLNCAPLRDSSARLYFQLVASLVCAWFTFWNGNTLAGSRSKSQSNWEILLLFCNKQDILCSVPTVRKISKPCIRSFWM